MRYLITGATGYIGGRLAPRLLGGEPDAEVRCLVRDPDKLRDVPWAADAEVVQGDLLDPDSVRRACAGVDVVYSLACSRSESGFAAADRRAALILADAARAAGVRRIVHLGVLRPATGSSPLPAHLASRAEVGETLLRSGVPTIVLQAAVVIGSGSAGFEMLRHLAELPLAVTPSWVRHPVQPIAVHDVLRYLIGAAALPSEVNRTFDIGGPEVLPYRDMMRRYALVAGLPRRRMLPVPLRAGRLSVQWVNLATPVTRPIAAPLVECMVHGAAVCSERDILAHVPDPPEGRTGFDRAVEQALSASTDGDVPTRWSGATVEDVPADPLPDDLERSAERVYLDRRERASTADPDRLWAVVEGVGGEHGWYSFPLAWSVRGWMDRLVGGPGLSRGRRHPDALRTGDALDWWRVERLRDRERAGSDDAWLLRLRAEMKVPGRAWLEMSVRPRTGGGSTYHQRAVFIPHGLPGYLYWWSVAPFHGIVFGGMARTITRTAEHARPGRPLRARLGTAPIRTGRSPRP